MTKKKLLQAISSVVSEEVDEVDLAGSVDRHRKGDADWQVATDDDVVVRWARGLTVKLA